MDFLHSLTTTPFIFVKTYEYEKAYFMKRFAFLFICFCFISKGYCQKFLWKPAIGGNLSIYNISNTLKNQGKSGFDAGLFVEKPLKQNFSIEVGWLYTLNKGSVKRAFIYPFDPAGIDPPDVIENYSIHLLKVPVSFIVKQKTPNPLYFGIGPEVKYNLSSNRNGYVVDRPDNYSDKFRVDTKRGSKFGLEINCTIGKEFKISTTKTSIKINYDTDLSQWRYPTNFELEKNTYYKMRSHNFSLLFSVIL
jgi:hypothetical protein